MYSSIEEDARKEVLTNCYWNIFLLAEAGVPISLEASGKTLEIINKLDNKWIEKLKRYIQLKLIEFVGSGYSQIIGPLVPHKVNSWNQNLGLEVYNDLLGITPKIALVNEMAYSGGIVEHYLDHQYDAIMMEWNNPRKYHPEWHNKLRYYPQRAVGTNERSIPLIWTDSIAFQKFQRYVHAEIELYEYINYLKNHTKINGTYFPLYSNDLEIFDYRPNRYDTESKKTAKSEFERIFKVYKFLKDENWAKLIFPSEVLNGLSKPHGGIEIYLQSPEQPLPVKKQDKYNINRWALTGRDDIGINTKCYQIYDGLVFNRNENSVDWKELCYLWSSDFRTHITEKRWKDYEKRLNTSVQKWKLTNNDDSKKFVNIDNSKFELTENEKLLIIQNKNIRIVFNKHKGLTIKEFIINDLSNKSLFGTLDHGYYDDISLGADYFSGHMVIQRSGEHKITDLEKVTPKIIQNEKSISLETQQNHGKYIVKSKIIIDVEALVIKKHFEYKSNEKLIIHPINITLNPNAWDQDSLYIKTHNGGKHADKFYLKGQSFSHRNVYSLLISACHGFGNTEGKFIVGDKEKEMNFESDMTESALIPSIVFLPQKDNKFLLRIHYSAGEIDETVKINPFIKKKVSSSINIYSISSSPKEILSNDISYLE